MKQTRVLFVGDSMTGGGGEQVIITLLRNLDRERFKPFLALFRVEGPNLTAVPPDVPIADLGGWDGHARELRLRYARRLKHIVAEHRIDLIHSHLNTVNQTVVRACLLGGVRCPVVVTEHGIPSRTIAWRPWSIGARWRRRQVRVLYQRASRVVTVSNGIKNELADKFGIPSDHIAAIHNPVDLAMVQRRATEPITPPWGHDASQPLIMGLGRLVEEKGFDGLIRVFASVRKRQPCRLLILGEGRCRRQLETLAQQLGVGESVFLPGHVDNPWPYVAHADIFIVSSQIEAFSLALVEASACGTPVIATDCNYGPREIIEQNKNGCLVPVGDTDTMATQILALLDHPEERQRLGQTGRHMAQRFDARIVIKKYERLFEEVLSTNVAPR